MLSRRTLLLGGASLALASSSLIRSANAKESFECWKEPIPDKPVKPEAAASMRKLFDDLALGGQPRLGMTRLDGFVRAKDDTIIYGRKMNNNATELLFEDLVLALQSLRGVYGSNDFGVSLDTKPGGYRALPQKTPESDAEKNSYRRTCIAEVGGTTRVFGIPHDCRVAKILLDADFRMKLVRWGSATLKIKEPFPCPSIQEQRIVFDRYLENRPLPARDPDPSHHGRSNRQWFQPGKQTYIEDGASVFMDCVQVVLKIMFHENDESEQKEDDAFTTLNHTLSRAWACAWTNRMNEVCASEPIWADMYSTFRHVALARTLEANKSQQVKLGPTAMEVLKRYRPPVIAVPAEMVFSDFRKITATRLGRNYWNNNQFCGGIDMAGSITPSTVKDATADVRLIEQLVLNSAKSCTTACWSI
jgi:hypothetical protein